MTELKPCPCGKQMEIDFYINGYVCIYCQCGWIEQPKPMTIEEATKKWNLIVEGTNESLNKEVHFR